MTVDKREFLYESFSSLCPDQTRPRVVRDFTSESLCCEREFYQLSCPIFTKLLTRIIHKFFYRFQLLMHFKGERRMSLFCHVSEQNTSDLSTAKGRLQCSNLPLSNIITSR